MYCYSTIKSGDKLSCGNYRPISLSLTISKIFEKCIKNRLLNYFKKNSFFSNSQFGFLAGLSTSDALFKLDNFVRRHIDINYKVMGIFLDVQKAFDSVNHELLLKKLEYSGIRGVANNLLKSFLNERTQIVQINECYSKAKDITCGVLGPLLFIFFINDLLNIK